MPILNSWTFDAESKTHRRNTQIVQLTTTSSCRRVAYGHPEDLRSSPPSWWNFTPPSLEATWVSQRPWHELVRILSGRL